MNAIAVLAGFATLLAFAWTPPLLIDATFRLKHGRWPNRDERI